MSANFPLSYQLNIVGAEEVRNKLALISEEFRQGQLSTREYTKELRGVIRDIGTFNRSIDLQSRLFLAMHPRLNLTIRAMSQLASVGRIAVSLFDSFNILQLALTEKSEGLRDATKDVSDKQLKYNEAVRDFGPESEQAITALEDLREAQEKLGFEQRQSAEATRNAIIQFGFMGIAALALIPQIAKLGFAVKLLHAVMAIPLPLLLGVAAGLAVFAFLWTTNLFNTRTALEAWATDTKSRFDAWYTETITLFKNWNNLTGDQVLAWALNTSAGIEEWMLDSLFGFTEWATDAIDIFSKWSEDLVEIFTTGTFDQLFSDKQQAILFEKANLVGAGINNAIIAALQAGFKGTILEPFFNDLRKVSQDRIQEIKDNIANLKNQIIEENRRATEISKISFGKDLVTPTITNNQGKIAQAFGGTVITTNLLDAPTIELSNELEKATESQMDTNSLIEDYANKLGEITNITQDTIDVSKDTDEFIKNLETGYERVRKIHEDDVIPATTELVRAESKTTAALDNLTKRIEEGFFTKKGRFIPGGSPLGEEALETIGNIAAGPTGAITTALQGVVNVLALDFKRRLLTIERGGKSKSLTQEQFDQFNISTIFANPDSKFKQARLNDIANALGLPSFQGLIGSVVFKQPQIVKVDAGETLTGARGGPRTELHLHIGTLIADKQSIRELADVVGKELARSALKMDRTL